MGDGQSDIGNRKSEIGHRKSDIGNRQWGNRQSAISQLTIVIQPVCNLQSPIGNALAVG
jgi:hypothetical protein